MKYLLAISILLGSALIAYAQTDVSVIVLPVEGLADQAAAVDVAISKQLAAEKKLVIVDRSMIEAVLMEKTAGEFRKKLAGGGWILSPRVVTAKNQRPLVFIDIVSARTGDTLSQQIFPLARQSQEKNLASIQKIVTRGITEARQVAERNELLLEVTGSLSQPQGRLSWMLDDMTATLGGTAERKGLARALTPRLQLSTKEERLLQVLGLAERAADGDGKIRFSPLPDVQLRVVLTDSMKPGVSFDDTSITLSLSLKDPTGKRTEGKLTGTVGRWEKLKGASQQWLVKQLSSLTRTQIDPTKAQDHARQRSREIVQSLKPLVEQVGQFGILGRGSIVGYSLRKRIVDRALRASHLDPTNEYAAWLIARNIGWQKKIPFNTREFHSREGQSQFQRALVEINQFYRRFPKASLSRKHQLLPGNAVELCRRLRNRTGAEEKYSLASPLAREAAEIWVRRQNGEKVEDSLYSRMYGKKEKVMVFLYRTIRNVPDEHIDQEYVYWKQYYAKKITPVLDKKTALDFSYNSNDPLPWPGVEAEFAARRKDVPGVKAALNALAGKFPVNWNLWKDGGSGRYTPLTVELLSRAGAADAKTWKPTMPSQAISIPFRDMDPFFMSLQGGHALSAWPIHKAPVLNMRSIRIPPELYKPKDAKGFKGPLPWAATFHAHIVPIDQSEIWVTISGNDQRDMRILSLTSGKNALGVQHERWREIKLPKSLRSSLFVQGERRIHFTMTQGAPTVWLAMQTGGLFRYTRDPKGKWSLRHYTQSDGLACASVEDVTSIADGKERRILLMGYGLDAKSRRVARALSLEPVSGKFTILKNWKRYSRWRINARAGDRPIVTGLLGASGYDAEFSELTEYTQDQKDQHGANIVLPESDGFRLFGYLRGYRGPRGGHMVLDEYDPATLRRLDTSPGASGKSMSMISFGHRSEYRPMGDILVPRYETVQIPGDWPDMLVNQTTALPKTIFASIQNRRMYYSRLYFVGYQPAPKGEKDWAKKDRWIGPFKSPDGRTITGIAGWGKNRLVLVTRGGMYIVQADEVLRQAEAKGQTCSTQQWRDSIADRLAKTNWRQVVIFYIGRQEWEKAAAVLSKVTDSKDQLHRMLWANYALARQGKWLEAAEGYQKAIEAAVAEKNHLAEAYAHTVRVVCLYRGERPKLAREALDVAVKRFPQLAPTKRDMLFKIMNAKSSKVKR